MTDHVSTLNHLTAHRLWPEEGTPLDYNPALTIIFFHGLQLRNGDRAWETTWKQRGSGEGGKQLVCWPKEWLPRDLGERKVVVYSLSYDADAFKWSDTGRGNSDDVSDIGKDLIHKLVDNSTLLGLEKTRSIALVGHSFGGLVIKSLMVEAKKQAKLRETAKKNILARRASDSCQAFLEKVNAVIFYSTPHSGSAAATGAKNLAKLAPYPALAGILKNLEPFERAMENLSVEFQDAAREDLNIFAFNEGRRTKAFGGLKSVMVVTYASGMRLANNNHMKVDDANHSEVCKPTDQGHDSYSKLLDLLRLVMPEADEDLT